METPAALTQTAWGTPGGRPMSMHLKRSSDATVHLDPLRASRELAMAVLEASDGTRCATLSCHPEIQRVVIGRGAEATIRLADAHVSRCHAWLSWQAQLGTHLIEDAGSDNGTYVDGVRLRRAVPLADGALLRLGRTVLRYRRPGPPAREQRGM